MPSDDAQDASVPPGQLAAGQLVGDGRYLLKNVLGQGGMGIVWLAYDKRLLEHVALKFLPPEITADQLALEDLRRETLRARRLTHPNIVRIHDLHQEPHQQPFISMEYVNGRDLHYLRAHHLNKVLSWKWLLPVIRQLCAALGYAHGQRIIHRDLKPANLLLDQEQNLKLTDFGIACAVSDSITRLTGKQDFRGTLNYMSPQQAEGKAPQFSDDIYSLGATLYELLTSRPPFHTGDIAYQIRNVRPDPIPQRLLELGLMNPVPAEASSLVLACLAKQPDERPQSAQALLDLLDSDQAQIASPASAPTTVATGNSPTSRTAVSPAIPAAVSTESIGEATSKRPSNLWIRVGAVSALVVLLALCAVTAVWLIHRYKSAPNESSSQLANQEPPGQAQPPNSSEASPPATPAQPTEVILIGHDLGNWSGDPRIWSVKDGAIVGHATRETLADKTQSCLVWNGTVDSFDLRFSFRLTGGNSGVIFRGKKADDRKMTGYEFQIVANNQCLQMIEPNGQIRQLSKNPDAAKRYRKGNWNDVEIAAHGRHVMIRLNGVTCANYRPADPAGEFLSGALGLEARLGDGGTPLNIEFKNIRLTPLKPSTP